MKRYEGWHFSAGREAYGEHRPIATGTRLDIEGEPKLCARGLHGSARAIDALSYARGSIASRVVLSGTIVIGTDKAVATRRHHKSVFDANGLLHRFAVWCAGMALTQEREAGREPDARSWAALDAKMQWLSGIATDEDLAAARDAARAARDASRAVGAAAWDAGAAARDAAGALGAAARAAARDSAWAAREAARGAAWAIGDFAKAAAVDEQNRILTAALVYVEGRN